MFTVNKEHRLVQRICKLSADFFSFFCIATVNLSNMKSLIFHAKREFNFQLGKNKFMSLYSPIKLRTIEAENWWKSENSQLQLKTNVVTIRLCQLKHKGY